MFFFSVFFERINNSWSKPFRRGTIYPSFAFYPFAESVETPILGTRESLLGTKGIQANVEHLVLRQGCGSPALLCWRRLWNDGHGGGLTHRWFRFGEMAVPTLVLLRGCWGVH